MSIRFKILAIVFSLFALIGLVFAVYSINTTANCRSLRLDGLHNNVAKMERNASDAFAGGAEQTDDVTMLVLRMSGHD